MASLKELDELGGLVDDAMQLAVQLNQSMTVYILSIARLEISERIEQLEDSDGDR